MLSWKEEYNCGISEIDLQHKNLYQNVNFLIEISKSDYKIEDAWQLINNIEDYAANHFDTEENYMITYGYEAYLIHCSAHSEFIDNYTQIKEKIEKSGITRELLVELTVFLMGWLLDHYTEEDALLIKFFKKVGNK